MAETVPVFYDCEASALEGYPIEIGWAFTGPDNGEVISESHLIKPAAEWDVPESWDPDAEALHGIMLDRLWKEGIPVWEIAARMNTALAGRELFSDSLQDESWLRLLFDAAGAEPAFSVRRIDARILIAQAAAKRWLTQADVAQAMTRAAEIAPPIHRAADDARYLATAWKIIINSA